MDTFESDFDEKSTTKYGESKCFLPDTHILHHSELISASLLDRIFQTILIAMLQPLRSLLLAPKKMRSARLDSSPLVPAPIFKLVSKKRSFVSSSLISAQDIHKTKMPMCLLKNESRSQTRLAFAPNQARLSRPPIGPFSHTNTAEAKQSSSRKILGPATPKKPKCTSQARYMKLHFGGIIRSSTVLRRGYQHADLSKHDLKPYTSSKTPRRKASYTRF